MERSAFHRKCDGLKNTISIIKCRFSGKSKSSRIGGCLDEAWHSNQKYINPSNSFIFSFSAQIKCLNQSNRMATFGGTTTVQFLEEAMTL